MKKMITIVAALALGASFGMAQCEDKAAAGCCGSKAKVASADAEFMAEASRMMALAEGKGAKAACCKSTAAKPVAKGEAGCCNAKGELAKFKVFVAGTGYQFFGCAGSAGKARSEMAKKGVRVGTVQAVTGRVMI